MGSTDRRVIQCGTHGSVHPAFVCCHLVRDELAPAGFHEAEPEPDDPEPMAWCDVCHAWLEAAGGWDDEVEAQFDLRLVCEFCFVRLRDLHARE